MFQEFKKRWEVLLFLVGVVATLLAAGRYIENRLNTLEATSNDVVQMKVSIQTIEDHILSECKKLGQSQYRDLESLIEMTRQLQKELVVQRENRIKIIFAEHPDPEILSDPDLILIKEMQNKWESIESNLGGLQKWYLSFTSQCSDTP